MAQFILWLKPIGFLAPIIVIKTLLIAPEIEAMPLHYQNAEIQAVLASGLPVTSVLGHVDSTRFLEVIDRNGHELLVFITHGTRQGVMLSDGLLPSDMLTTAIRDKFDMVLLNTCDGIEVAQMLQNECNTSVLCTVGEADDRQAFYTGSRFVRELARGKSYFDAYKQSKPGNNKLYVFLAGRASRLSMREMQNGLTTEIHALEERMNKKFTNVDRRLDTIETQIGDKKTTTVAITNAQIQQILWALISIAVVVAVGFFYLSNGGG